MSDPKGEYLYVNLSAARTKQRLKGFGHGVRKIQSTGKNRAVVIHTATGDNLEELEAQFLDVGCSAREDELSEPIENLRNLGTTSGRWLRDVGINTIADLETRDPVFVFLLVRGRQSNVSLNFLWAMVAGLQDRDWLELTDEEKRSLRLDLADS